MKLKTKLLLSTGTALLALVAVYLGFFSDRYPMGMMHHGMHHGQHDEATMPGLNGRDTTTQEVNDLRTLFQKHQDIRRSVEELPNGIRTVTESDDPDVRVAIVTHVSQMIARLQTQRNPEVIIQSPTLDKLFEVAQQIETQIIPTETGVQVIQTSSNPDVVALLQTHAAEVSDLSSRGMRAVHERIKSH